LWRAYATISTMQAGSVEETFGGDRSSHQYRSFLSWDFWRAEQKWYMLT
jgi:hypothetical protein